MNKKGLAEIVLIALLALGAIGIVFGPKLIGSVGDVFNGGNKNQLRQTEKLSESYPIGHLDQKGNFVKMGDYKKSEDRLNLIAQQPPEKWSTKIKIILGVLVVLAIAFPTITTKLWLKAKTNMAQIITGIEQAKKAMPKSSIDTLENNLSNKMDLSAKKQVKAVRATIKADDIAKPVVVVAPTGV
jgi:flagellar basal body-associated protein FliL